MTLGVGVVGAGLIGARRAQAAARGPGSSLVAVADSQPDRARALADTLGCVVEDDFGAIVRRPDVDIVVVATPHKFLPEVASAALRAGKHVLCEKPLARNAAEAEPVVRLAEEAGLTLVAGFTLRYHPGIARARDLLLAGAIGDPYLIRGRYGHGGRPGYDAEWRGDADLAGGGELLDQGIHLIDLSRWFLGEFEDVTGLIGTYHWNVAPLEDNGFVLMRTAAGQIASLHASWTQWKNLFSLEVFGRDGSLMVEGLGGSYGPERLTIARRRPAGGPPEIEETAFDADPAGAGDVWDREWAGCLAAIRGEPSPAATGFDAWQALRVVNRVYLASRGGDAPGPDRRPEPGRR